MLKNISFLLIVFNLFSCSFFNDKENTDSRKPIAKVNDAFLYYEDIDKLLPKTYNKNDSILLVNNIINSWAKKQILLSKARLNLNEDDVQIENLVNKYKEDLLINKYKEAVINQNLDTIVNQVDIDFFYKENKETFKLNEELMQLRFIQIDANMDNKDEIKELFYANDKQSLEELIEKELEYKSFFFNDSIWVKYSEVLRKIPLITKNDIKNSVKSKFITKQDSLNTYFIKVNKVLKRNNTSPKSYVRQTIIQMILHTRKLKLLKKIERTLLNDANKNGQYEIYK